jgi:hypothetical protein
MTPFSNYKSQFPPRSSFFLSLSILISSYLVDSVKIIAIENPKPKPKTQNPKPKTQTNPPAIKMSITIQNILQEVTKIDNERQQRVAETRRLSHAIMMGLLDARQEELVSECQCFPW